MSSPDPYNTREVAVALAERLAARPKPVELPLTHDEFTAYVLALRSYWFRANTYDYEDWRRRQRATDLLREVSRQLGGDSIDTAHLRACNESRASVLGDKSPYPLRLAGEVAGSAVMALDEYRWIGNLRWQPFAAALLDRIAEAVGQ